MSFSICDFIHPQAARLWRKSLLILQLQKFIILPTVDLGSFSCFTTKLLHLKLALLGEKINLRNVALNAIVRRLSGQP